MWKASSIVIIAYETIGNTSQWDLIWYFIERSAETVPRLLLVLGWIEQISSYWYMLIEEAWEVFLEEQDLADENTCARGCTEEQNLINNSSYTWRSMCMSFSVSTWVLMYVSVPLVILRPFLCWDLEILEISKCRWSSCRVINERMYLSSLYRLFHSIHHLSQSFVKKDSI